jgi:predicted Zn-dependent peptidase
MYNKLTLDNGVRLVYEKIPYLRSVAVGVWIRTGSINENELNNGVSHFIEHMLFKGTETMSAKEIADSIESIGGQLNAFTAKECTCFYAMTLDEHLGTSLRVLADIFFHSKFYEEDIRKERDVIFEEISSYEDTPDDLVHDVLTKLAWKSSSLGMPVLGTRKSLSKLDRQSITGYMSQNYTPANTVVAVAGNFDEKYLTDTVGQLFGGWTGAGNEAPLEVDAQQFSKGIKVKAKDIEQVHVCIGLEGVEQGDDRLFPLAAINNIFGGNMSSRLFQKIREDKGLVYSIYSYPSAYVRNGLFTIYAGMNPSNLKTVINMIAEEINILVKQGISVEELDKAKEQLKGSYILGLESTSSRMNSIGKSELLLGYIKTPDEILEKISAVNMDSVRETTGRVFDPEKIALALVGKVDKQTKEDLSRGMFT